MNILIDAMGGDNAPAEIVRGAVDAQKEFGVDITLVGRRADILSSLEENGIDGETEHLKIADASEVVDMHDDPSTAVRRKRDSSMSIGLGMVRDGKGDAFISAGSTGALLAGSTLAVRRITGIRRAALAPTLPNGGKGTLLIDCGANVECTAEQLLQFAYMGSFYSRSVLGCDNPRIGLLNIGTEDTKGTDLCKAAYALLEDAKKAGRINFIGNIESSDALSGTVDVIVCDGFSGNLLLKGIEGVAKTFVKMIKGNVFTGFSGKLSGFFIKEKFKKLMKLFDASEIGGTPLLGIAKPVIKAHGGSDARAIRSAVMQAIKVVETGLVDEIAQNAEYMKIGQSAEEGTTS